MKKKFKAYVVNSRYVRGEDVSIKIVGERGGYPEIEIIYGDDVVFADVSPDKKTLWVRTYKGKNVSVTIDFRHNPQIVIVKTK